MLTTTINNILKDYLSSNENDYAILLNGQWGVGKTYFIDEYFKRNEYPSNKILKISLFGIKKIDDINEKIFSALHPIAGSKFSKIGFNALKGALKLTIKLDLNSDNKDETSLNLDGKILEYLGLKNDISKLIFIFDDLERSNIDLPELFGYISNIIDSNEAKIIIIANEDEIRQINEFKK